MRRYFYFLLTCGTVITTIVNAQDQPDGLISVIIKHLVLAGQIQPIGR
jgi:hypothetical protein